MNIPADWIMVVVTTSMIGLWRSTAAHALRPTGATWSPAGSARQTAIDTSSDSPPTSPMLTRQPSVLEMKVPSGTPTTLATLQPRKTKLMARPRVRASTSSGSVAAACGV
ncbi:hypothetical protein D3C87_1409480 [compost metagenome]